MQNTKTTQEQWNELPLCRPLPTSEAARLIGINHQSLLNIANRKKLPPNVKLRKYGTVNLFERID